MFSFVHNKTTSISFSNAIIYELILFTSSRLNHFIIRLFDRADFDEINLKISRKLDELFIPTNANLQRVNIEEIVTELHLTFQSVIEGHVPSSAVKSNVRISDQSMSILKEKQRLCRLLNRRRNNQRAHDQEFSTIHSSINQVTTMIKNSLCHDFSNFYQRRLLQVRTNRDAFNVVRQFSQFKCKATDINNIFLDENKQVSVSDPNEVAKEFACQFLKNHELTAGVGFLPNHLLASASFPTDWKHAICCPIPKPGKDSTYIANWRRNSVLNSISKIFEIILKRRIRNHFDSNKISSNDQFGFRQKRSTLHALAKFHNSIMSE